MPLEPRKTPRQKRSAATFDAIIEAAARILECDGLAGLNTNAVAERAGVSIGSLYQYFPDKASILAELIRRERARLLAALDDELSNSRTASLDEVMRRLVQAAVKHQFGRAKLARELEYAEDSLPLGGETATLAGAIETRVARLLSAEGMNAAETLARDIVAIAKGMIDAAGLAGERDADALGQRVCRAVFSYLDATRRLARA